MRSKKSNDHVHEYDERGQCISIVAMPYGTITMELKEFFEIRYILDIITKELNKK